MNVHTSDGCCPFRSKFFIANRHPGRIELPPSLGRIDGDVVQGTDEFRCIDASEFVTPFVGSFKCCGENGLFERWHDVVEKGFLFIWADLSHHKYQELDAIEVMGGVYADGLTLIAHGET